MPATATGGSCENDHAAVKKLLANFGRATARTAKKRQALMDRIAKELKPAVLQRAAAISATSRSTFATIRSRAAA